jgi:hypothetical protein
MKKNFRDNPLKKDAEPRRLQNEGLMSSKKRSTLRRIILNAIFPRRKRKTLSKSKGANLKSKNNGSMRATSRKL